MGTIPKDDGWRIPDELWGEIKRLLPVRKAHPLGCHNPRVSDRAAMDAIFFVLRTGCKWAALDSMEFCSRSSAHRRFAEWKEAGVFDQLRLRGFFACEKLFEIDLKRLTRDRANDATC